MKKILYAVIVAAVILSAMPAMAGSVSDRVTFNGATNKIGMWTNNFATYFAFKLDRVCVERSTFLTNTISLNRITADGLYTQAICTVTTTNQCPNVYGAGVNASPLTKILKCGDIVYATGADGGVAISNTYTVILEGEVQGRE